MGFGDAIRGIVAPVKDEEAHNVSCETGILTMKRMKMVWGYPGVQRQSREGCAAWQKGNLCEAV